MFRNTLDFRQQWRLDTIVDEYKPPQVQWPRPRLLPADDRGVVA